MVSTSWPNKSLKKVNESVLQSPQRIALNFWFSVRDYSRSFLKGLQCSFKFLRKSLFQKTIDVLKSSTDASHNMTHVFFFCCNILVEYSLHAHAIPHHSLDIKCTRKCPRRHLSNWKFRDTPKYSLKHFLFCVSSTSSAYLWCWTMETEMRALRRYHRKHALRKYDRKHATRRYHKKAWKGKYELHLLHILSQKDKKSLFLLWFIQGFYGR